MAKKYKKHRRNNRQPGEVNKNIMEYMNVILPDKRSTEYTYREVSAIATAIKEEWYQRESRSEGINIRARSGKAEINERIVSIANGILQGGSLTVKDVEHYKKSRLYEYEERTGKSPWRFKDYLIRYGYDPDTARSTDE